MGIKQLTVEGNDLSRQLRHMLNKAGDMAFFLVAILQTGRDELAFRKVYVWFLEKHEKLLFMFVFIISLEK